MYHSGTFSPPVRDPRAVAVTTCANCGAEFERRGRRRCCTDTCAKALRARGRWPEGAAKHLCARKGCRKFVPPWQKYCGRPHYGADLGEINAKRRKARPKRLCERSGCAAPRTTGQHYCSPECYHLATKGKERKKRGSWVKCPDCRRVRYLPRNRAEHRRSDLCRACFAARRRASRRRSEKCPWCKKPGNHDRRSCYGRSRIDQARNPELARRLAEILAAGGHPGGNVALARALRVSTSTVYKLKRGLKQQTGGPKCAKCGGTVTKRSLLCGPCWREKTRVPRVKALCPWCQIEVARGTRNPVDIGVQLMRRTEYRASNLHFCGHPHERLYFNERARPCPTCGKRRRKKKGQKYCNRQCYLTWLTTHPVAARSRAELSDARVRAAWEAGVRGIRPLARQARVSTDTVYAALDRLGLRR